MVRGGACLLLVFCTACVQTPAERVQNAERTAQREHQPDKLVERGKAFAQVGDYTRAGQYFASALDAGADQKTVLPLLMGTYVKSGRYRMGIDVGVHYLTEHPNNYSLRYLVAALYSAIGDVKQARAEYEGVLAIKPDYPEAHYSLAVLFRDSLGDWVRADYHFREYLRLEPNGSHVEEARASLLKKVP